MNFYPQIEEITTGLSTATTSDRFAEVMRSHKTKTNYWLKKNAEKIQVHSVQTIIFGEIAITTIIAYQAE